MVAGGPSSAEVPISLVPDIPVPEDGVVSLSLAHITLWLAEMKPASDFQIVIQARCDPDGPWATQLVTSENDKPDTGTPSIATPPAPGPSESASVGVTEGNGQASTTGDTAPSLAETGADESGLIGSIAASVLFLLVGSVFLLTRHRFVHQR